MRKIDRNKLAKLVGKWKLRQPLKAELMKWVCDADAEFNYFITLTYSTGGTSREDVEKHGRYFLQRYNKALKFKKFWKKSKTDKTKQAQMIGIIEGDGKFKRYHYHFLLHKPNDMSLLDFSLKIRRCWYFATDKRGSFWGIDFARIRDFIGLTNYLTKEVTSKNIDALNLGATHIY